MNSPMRRGFAVLPTIAIVVAACAGPGTSGSEADSENSPSMAAGSHDMSSSAPSSSSSPGTGEPSASPAASDAGSGGDVDARVAIDDVLTDPAAFEGQPVTLSENIERVFIDDLAFELTGTEVEGQVLVVVTPDARVGKEIEADRVVTVTGTLAPFTGEDLHAAGAGIAIDDEALAEFEGDAVLVATEVADPLGS